MEMHCGQLLMHIQNALHHRKIFIVCGAVIVDHDVVAFRPIGAIEYRKRRIGAAILRPQNIDAYLRPLLNPLTEYSHLVLVIMATAAGDQQRLQLGLLFSRQRRASLPPQPKPNTEKTSG
jgi:hypothetical protein